MQDLKLLNNKAKDSESLKLWHLYGNTYDLQKFQKIHPGGEQILKMTQGHLDITPMFESYHTFANIEKLKEDLNTYKVGQSEYKQRYTFKKGDFYDVVRQRVRTYFGASSEVLNVNKNVKINHFWFIKCSILTFIYFLSLYMAFLNTEISIFSGIIWGFVAGVMLVSIGMCLFHDASHFALFRKNPMMNDIFNRFMSALFMWRSECWQMHHAFRHHAYTGDAALDPDVANYRPLVQKTNRVDHSKYLPLPKSLINIIVPFFMWVFPGQFFGQGIIYLKWEIYGFVWGMHYPKKTTKRYLYENLTLIAIILIHFYRFNFFISAFYFIGLNIAYSLAIIPDHDTKQTHENYDESKKDWGETQVRNAGNFENKRHFDWYFHVFGGINYQIEHHLFPSMNSVHLNKIAPIVIKTCKEFNIPYVSHKSVFSAYYDFFDNVRQNY